MTRATRLAAAAALIAALSLATACGELPAQGTADRADSKPAAEEPTVDEAAEEEPAPEEPDTELKVGDAFKYNDGVTVTVSKISKLTQFGQWDVGPEKGETGFRVHWSVNNGSKKPISLDEWGATAGGASTGGETTMIMVEAGSKPLTGRIAPGKSAQFTDEYAIKASEGPSIVATMTRMDLEDASILAEDPNWTGDIK